MTNVQINQVGTDLLELEIIQSGSHEASVTLNHTILDGTKSYHFALSELNAPLVEIPIFGWITQPIELFRIVRRNEGVVYNAETSVEIITFLAEQVLNNIDLDDYDYLGLDYTGLTNAQIEDLILHTLYAIHTINSLLPTTGVVDPSDIYRIKPGRKFYDAGEFVRSLQDWAMMFNKELLKAGLDRDEYGGVAPSRPVITENADGSFQLQNGDPYEYDIETDNFLTIGLNCDGALQFVGLAAFWNNFTIQFTNTGAAILGVDTDRLQGNVMAFTENSQTVPFKTDQDLLEEGANTNTLVPSFKQSIFQSAECRLKISVDSMLPMSSNIIIRDEKQSISRDIGSAYFLNEIRTETTWDETGTYAGLKIKSKVYSGQYAFIKKDQPISQWTRLLNSENLVFLRFFLMITYRAFSETTGKWGIVTQNFKVPLESYWQMVIRFVSDE